MTPKCFDILQVLVEHSGYLVEKEELMKAVWSDAFVEEGNLTQSISLLRKALGDSSDGPHYIETIPRHGYRFVAPVKTQLSEVGTLEGPVEATVSSRLEQTSRLSELPVHRLGRKLAIGGVIGVILAGMILTWFTWHRQRREITTRAELTAQRLTANSPENAVLAAAISPDAKYLSPSSGSSRSDALKSPGLNVRIKAAKAKQAGRCRNRYKSHSAESHRLPH